MKVSLIALALGAVCVAAADQVVPNGFADTPGNLSFTMSTTAVAGRTYQIQLSASQLTNLVGTNLTGLQFRLNESATANWPNVSTTYSDFSIFIGQGVGAAARSTVFADNFVGTPTQVRSGALVVDGGAYSSLGSPVKPFGPTISFGSAYTYNGGHLTIELRYSGHAGASSNPVFDAVGNTVAGYGTDFAASWASGTTATTATGSPNANMFVTNIVSAPVPEPATVAALGAGLALLARRRRRA